jgi:hypothetical protein
MATTAYSLVEDWIAQNRYTASGDTDIILSNTGARIVTWSLTDTNAKPQITVKQGHPVLPFQSRAMRLKDGERIWFAGENATASLGV